MGKALVSARGTCFAAVTVCVSMLTVGLDAQTTTPTPENDRERVQIGALGVTPSLALTNMGVDTNVFNEFDDPKRDFTFTVAPQVRTSVRMRRVRFQAVTRTDLTYFQRYASERSVGTAVESRLEVRGNRLTPWVESSISSGRQRYGYDVDLRFRRTVAVVGAGVEGRVAGRTRVSMSARRAHYRHDSDAVFLNQRLEEVLNRRSDTIGVDLRHNLTPLTTLVVSAQAITDRFDFTPDRDTDGVRVEAGFDLSPFALISGRGRVGYRALRGVGTTPDFSGVVASVAAGSTLRGRTRLDVTVERDVNYSLELDHPYFVQTGIGLALTPQLTPRWDVQGRASLQRLAYRASRGLSDMLPTRVDRDALVGVGLGYRLGQQMRVGLNVDRERRVSPVQRRAYLGYRTGLSVTYGR